MKKIRLKKARRNHEAKQPSQLCNTLDSGVAHPFRGSGEYASEDVWEYRVECKV